MNYKIKKNHNKIKKVNTKKEQEELFKRECKKRTAYNNAHLLEQKYGSATY